MNLMLAGVAVRGQVDGFEGTYVVGWAVRNNGEECAITIRAEDGKIVAKGRASRNRPDLLSLGVGKTNIAFRIPIPDIDAHRELRVFADEVELQPSPIRVGPGLYNGSFAAHGGVAQGWVTERTVGFAAPAITIKDQRGRVVAQTVASLPDGDCDPCFAPAEFLVELSDDCIGCHDLRLTAFANGVPFATAECSLSFKGTLETLTESRCSGWLYCPEAPDRVLPLDIFVNGELAATAKCDLIRTDVRAVHPECKTSGFDVILPPRRLAATELMTVSLRIHGSEMEILDGPYVTGSAAAVVAASRRAAQIFTAADEFSEAERSVVLRAISGFLAKAREQEPFMAGKQYRAVVHDDAPRLNIIIPVYRDTTVTAECIRSVLAHRIELQDRIVLVNDRSPEPDMAEVLHYFATFPNVVLLTNQTNLGFVKSVNRGLRFCSSGDVILLNSDTEVFAGGLEEMWKVAHSRGNIGTVTALSNNATIFSYPHASLRGPELDDIGWGEVAAQAMQANGGVAIDMPTGHGFCMLIRREILDRLGLLDEVFGRGYGEENDFCARAADLGYRNVAAPGAFVRHRESVSFVENKSALLKANLAILEDRYPEYTPTIMEAERTDPLRTARWPLDRERLRRAGVAGTRFAVVVSNWLGGGTEKAIGDIEDAVGYGGAAKIGVQCREDGYVEITVATPAIRAVFAPSEVGPLFLMLSSAPVAVVVVHQLLGFSAAFTETLTDWARERNAVFYAHDFYSLCPRVTMIDASGEFCNVAGADVCSRCVALGGVHAASATAELTAVEHRVLFGAALANFRRVVAPSASTAGYLKRAFPGLDVTVVPHPEPRVTFPARARAGSDDEVVLLGAIGPHKGSRELLEIARRAQLVNPALRFRVIGYTDIDDQLRALGNVTITGPYKQADLPRRLRAARGRLALFLSAWPETYSYTLSEVVAQGFIPFVPDVGAPADRVRQSGFGVILGFPVDPVEVVRAIGDFAAGRRDLWRKGAAPADFDGSRAQLAVEDSLVA